MPAIILIGGLVATCASTLVLWCSAEARDRQRFMHATDLELRTIQDQFGTYTALLQGAAGLFAAERDAVSLLDFKAYAQRIDLEHRYPGFLGIGFTRSLPTGEQPALTEEMRRQGVADFHIHPATDAATVSPVVFAEPPNPRNLAAIGYDVSSDPMRRRMVERARDTGTPATSARLQLVQEIDENKQAGFLVAMPVYAGGAVPPTVEERRRAFFGFVFGAFRADDLFRSIVPTTTEDDVAFAVYDGAPGAATLLHRSSPALASAAEARYSQTFPIEVGGRTWNVVFSSQPFQDDRSGRKDAWFLLVGGLLATGLLALAALKERRTREEVQRLNKSLETRVEERTSELQRANRDLLQAGEERQRMEEQLRQAQKMEAVGQLTGGIAHDFNNLLTAIGGSLELLQTRVAQGRTGSLDRYLAAAQDAGRRAAALTHRLLAFSRRQTLDPRPTDINRLVAEMEDLLRRTTGPGIAVEVVGASGLWSTLVDPNQLENALLNLCINARDAMPEGGRLTIRSGNAAFDEQEARERGMKPGQYVSLCVSDTGMGMSPDVVARAFDPFFTTKPLGQGTGLGLSMIYGFVRQSGGQARIRSQPGEGTSVCLLLPRHHGDAERAGVPARLADVPRARRGQAVLVIDDETTVRMLVGEVLRDLGYVVTEAEDGAGGLRVLRSDARIDLLVTDVGLPGGMDGRQVAEAARALRPGLRVLFITGYAQTALLDGRRLAPGTHVMTKPFEMQALADRIGEILDGPCEQAARQAG